MMNNVDLKAQTVLNQLKTQQPPQPTMSNTSFGQCRECGLIHPPLPPGQKCPNAPLEVEDKNGNKLKINTDKYFVTLKNILFSQVETKKIKDIDKLFKELTVNNVKFLEEYNE